MEEDIEYHEVLREIFYSFYDNLLEVEKKDEDLDQKRIHLQNRIKRMILFKCRDHEKWYFENTKYNPGKSQQYYIEDSKKEEEKQILKELQNCGSKYDFGFFNELKEIEKSIKQSKINYETCKGKCKEYLKDKNRLALKKCLTKCCEKYLNEGKKIQFRFDKEIHRTDEMLDKL